MRVRNISGFNEVALPGMVKRVEPPFVWPWIGGWVKTNFSGGGRVHFTNKWKGSVQVGVPRDRAGSKERRRNEGCSGIDQRLGCQSDTRHEYSWVLQTWNALGDAALEDANLACCQEHEQPNSETWWCHPKNAPTELKRMTRWGAAREAENAPALLRAAAGSLWSILVWEDFLRVNPRSIDLSRNGCHILSNLQSSDADLYCPGYCTSHRHLR